MKPLVSVVMPVRNGQAYLAEALESILAQTHRELELLIVDNGSSDDSAQIESEFAARDNRVRVIREPRVGLVPALNAGFRAAQGEFIARMDADDISWPQRIARQVDLLTQRPEVGVCGTAAVCFGGNTRKIEVYVDDPALRMQQLFASPMVHPTVMMRRTLRDRLDGPYRLESGLSEDVELWIRCAQYARLANIPDVLLNYRVHSQQFTQVRRQGTHDSHVRACLALWRQCGVDWDCESAMRALTWPRTYSAPLADVLRAWRDLTRGIAANPDHPRQIVVLRHYFLRWAAYLPLRQLDRVLAALKPTVANPLE